MTRCPALFEPGATGLHRRDPAGREGSGLGTGPGLSKRAQQEIWQCFRCGDDLPVRSSAERGLGLGLYICQTLIEAHQGAVGVESTPGSGSTFWFALPVLDHARKLS